MGQLASEVQEGNADKAETLPTIDINNIAAVRNKAICFITYMRYFLVYNLNYNFKFD